MINFISLYMYNNTPYVAFSDMGDELNRITVMKYDGVNWVIVENKYVSEGRADYITLMIENGYIYVGYKDYANSGGATVMKYDGTNWMAVGNKNISNGAVGNTSLYIYNGIPYIAFSEGKNMNRATVMKYDGTNWVEVGDRGFSDGYAGNISIKVYNGIPYVAYSDSSVSHKVTVMKYEGTNWEVIGEKGISAGEANYTSLYISLNGIPYVSYSDVAYSRGVVVKKYDYEPVPPTPLPTPIPPKDRAIDWLHTMQLTDPGTPPDVYGAWGLNMNRWLPFTYCTDNGNNVTYTASVAMTALAILSLLNEGAYYYFTNIVSRPVQNLILSLSINDPAIDLGIDYILRNWRQWYQHPNGAWGGPISDWENVYVGYPYNTYDTASALVALSAYRRVKRIMGQWNPSVDARQAQIEQVMQGGWMFLMDNQCIEYNRGGNLRYSRLNAYFDPQSYDESNCNYGGWGYPRQNWADMSNTQFAVWALEVLDTETRNYDDPFRLLPDHDNLAAPLLGPGIVYNTLEFYYERRQKAYGFIRNSNEHPEYYEQKPYIEAAAGGLYGAPGCEQRTLHNAGYPYGSITAAGVWSLYCVNHPWTPISPNNIGPINPSDPVAWNEILWLQNYHTPARNPVDPSNPDVIGEKRWYYYYIMTFMKAILMNGVTTIPGWYNQYRNQLVSIVQDTGCVPQNWPYGHSLLYWTNQGEEQEPDVLSTIFSILGIETALGPWPYNIPGMTPNRLYIELMSEAEIVIIDESNRKTGCENGMNYVNIPESRFSGCGTEPQRIEIDWPGGVYRLKIRATGDGYITIKAGTEFVGHRMSEYSHSITVVAGNIYEYTVSAGNVYWPMTLSCSFARGEEVTPEMTATRTPTMTQSRTESPTATPTRTQTNTRTPTLTMTQTITRTATLTHTKTPTPTRTATPLPVKLILEFKAGDIYRYSASPHPQFRIKNKGTGQIDVSKLEIRYWYKYDGVLKTEQSYVDWAGINGTAITDKVNISIVSWIFSMQDRYLKVTFKLGAGQLGNGANDYLEVNTRFNKNDWSRYDQSNDWSFVSYTSFKEWEKVTVYYNGVKVYGREPGEVGYTMVKEEEEEINDTNTYIYPNPVKERAIIRYVAGGGGVKIEINDMRGRKIWGKEKKAGEVRAGVNYEEWCLVDDTGQEVSNGVYVVKIKAGSKEIVKKVAVVR